MNLRLSVTLFNKKIMGYILIFAIAVMTGLAVGKIYVDNLEAPSTVSAEESSLREAEATIKEWVDRAEKREESGESIDSFTVVQLYNIAEYKLTHSEDYYSGKFFKLMTGVVNAPMGIKQQMRSEKIYDNGTFLYNKLSPSTSSLAPAICSRVVYDKNSGVIKINPKGTFDEGADVITGIFDKNNYDEYTLEEYKSIFNTEPSTVMPYIISTITCGQNKVSPVTKNADGTYSFSIAIDGDYLALAALYYSYEIKFSSGMADPPKWVSLNMNVTIDENFNFVGIDYTEVYKMNVSGIGMMTVTDEFSDQFFFGEDALEIGDEIKEVL